MWSVSNPSWATAATPSTMNPMPVINAMNSSRLHRRAATAIPRPASTTPSASDTPYPYARHGARAFLDDMPIIEPYALVPFLAAQTARIRFTTFVLKLAIRPAVLVAKQAASIAVLSGDRLRLGVGISPWPEDFAAMQLPWERRGVRMDETVDVVRGLTAGGWFEYDGEVLHV